MARLRCKKNEYRVVSRSTKSFTSPEKVLTCEKSEWAANNRVAAFRAQRRDAWTRGGTTEYYAIAPDGTRLTYYYRNARRV